MIKKFSTFNLALFMVMLMTPLPSYGASQKKVYLQNRGTQTAPVIAIYNTYHGPVEVEIRLAGGRNISSDPVLPARFVVGPSGHMDAVRLWPSVPGTSWSYRHSYRFTLGDSGAIHRPSKPYRPPFPDGRRFRISKSFSENRGQGAAYDTHSVNILMPGGADVCAARPGIVMEITTQTFRAKAGKRIIEGLTTLIRIVHNDGTMAVYAHLAQGAARCQVGASVAEGQVIARCGRVSGDDPYLHFVIHKNAGMRLVSVPFQFAGEGGKGVTPVTGMVLSTR